MKKQGKEHLLDTFSQEVFKIKQRFESIGVTSRTLGTQEFKQVVIDLKKILSHSDYLITFNVIQKDKKLAKLAESIRGVYSRYYIYQESKAALDTISNKSKKTFISNNKTLGEKEIELSKINKESHVFFIGSGPFPWTAISYAKSTGCKVTCIDKDSEAVNISRRLIKTLKLYSQIDIACTGAQDFNYYLATHVVIAAMVHSKVAVLKKVKETSKHNLKIILRSSFGLYFFIFERIDRDILKDFKIINTISVGENSELISYILSKK
ncbi:MAG: nicotianamine synthase family protein [Patescibacteria group bacterium]